MILIPRDAAERAFTVDWFLDDVARGCVPHEDVGAMLAQLRLAGDLVNLERVARVLAERRAA